MPIGAYKTLGDLLVQWLNGQEVMQTLVLTAVYKPYVVVETEADDEIHVFVTGVQRTSVPDDRRGHWQRLWTMAVIVQKKLTSTSEADAAIEIHALNSLVDEIEYLMCAVPIGSGFFGEYALQEIDADPGKPPFDDELMQRNNFVSVLQCKFLTIDGLNVP